MVRATDETEVRAADKTEICPADGTEIRATDGSVTTVLPTGRASRLWTPESRHGYTLAT